MPLAMLHRQDLIARPMKVISDVRYFLEDCAKRVAA